MSALPALALVPRPGSAAVATSGTLFATVPTAERITLPDPEAQRQAEQRRDILAPVLDFLENPARYARLRLADGRAINSLERMIQHTAPAGGQSVRTVKYWLARYRRGGLVALADHTRTDKGTSRWFVRHPEARTFAAYLYLVERMSVSFVHEQLEHDAAQLGIQGDLPSYNTVRVFLSQSISPAMKTYARDGERAYRERMAPYLKRSYAEPANKIWVGDHMIHDIEISNDIFEDVPPGTPGRLRLSAFVDYRSRKAWGTWAWEGNSRSIAATLLRGILEVGPPEHIYVDNGKDYRKVARGARRGADDGPDASPWWQQEYSAIERTGFLARLGISVTHCQPRHPQSKHVERFFRTLHERFDKAHETYTSGSPATRPAATEAAMMRHRWLMRKGRVSESTHPLASQVILGCLAWIEEYNNTPHSGEGMDGRTPNQVFAAERNPNQKPTPDPDKLAVLLFDFARRKVRECAVQLFNHRYTPRAEDRSAWAAMHEANESEVLIAYNANDPEYVAALDLDGRILAWLEAEATVRFAPWDAGTQDQIGRSMEIRRGLEKATKQSLRVIASAARANGAKSAQELLYDRLELPAALDSLVTQPKPKLKPKPAQAPMTPAAVARMLLEE
jgi:putative transposase